MSSKTHSFTTYFLFRLFFSILFLNDPRSLILLFSHFFLFVTSVLFLNYSRCLVLFLLPLFLLFPFTGFPVSFLDCPSSLVLFFSYTLFLFLCRTSSVLLLNYSSCLILFFLIPLFLITALFFFNFSIFWLYIAMVKVRAFTIFSILDIFIFNVFNHGAFIKCTYLRLRIILLATFNCDIIKWCSGEITISINSCFDYCISVFMCNVETWFDKFKKEWVNEIWYILNLGWALIRYHFI